VLQFAVERERDAFSDALAAALARARAGAAGPAAAAGAAAEAHAAVARAALLATNADVAALHAQLVAPGILSEADFWGAQAALLADATSRRALGQRPGLANALLGEVRGGQDGRSRKVNFSLSGEQIAQIFAEHPAVRSAYLAHVPTGKLSDVEFWTKYCKSVYFRAARRGAAAESEAEAADAALFAPDEDALAKDAAQRVTAVAPSLNLAADADDAFAPRERGNAHGGAREAPPRASGPLAAIVRDINRHAAVVLDGRPDAPEADTGALASAMAARAAAAAAAARAGRSGAAAAEAAVPLPDLRDQAPPQRQELRIQDPRRYFDAAQAGAGERTLGNGGGLKPGPPQPPLQQQAASLLCAPAEAVPPALAARVLRDLGHAAATATAASVALGTGVGAAPAPVDSAVPALTTEEFRAAARAARELLRHFWGGAAPGPGSAPPATQQSAKRRRMRDALAAIYDGLGATKDALPAAGRHAAGQQLRPLMAALDAAFEEAERCGMGAPQPHAAPVSFAPTRKRPAADVITVD